MYKNDQEDYTFDSVETIRFESISVKDQVKEKEKHIEKLFDQKVSPMVMNPKPRGYRHKAVLSATNIKVGNSFQIRLGLFVEGSKDIKPRNGHYLHDAKIDEVFKTIESLLIKYKFKAYQKRYQEGIIKHVMIRKSFDSGELMVVFATQNNVFPNHRKFINELILAHPEVRTVVQNIHRKETHLVLLEEEKILYGKGFITDAIDGFKFQISSRSFYQVNPMQMFNIYDYALKIAEIKPTDLVVDCYSGIGTLSILASKYAKTVYGLEINSSSVANAITNKKLNNIPNVHFIQGDVEDTLEKLNEPIDILIMDPTRDGASLKFIEIVKKIKPKKIVYISCNPDTQIRDIKQIGFMYKLLNIQPFDMFTYTSHVENVILLELK